MIKFDSYNKKFKKPFGAVRENEPIEYCVLAHSTLKIEHINLVVRDRDEQKFTLCKSGQENEYDVFCATVKIENASLYRYRFEAVLKDESMLFIGTNDGHTAVIGDWLPEWHLTVYDKDFYTSKIPEGAIMYQIFPDRFFKGENANISNSANERIIHHDWNEDPHCYYDYEGFKCNDFFMGNLAGIEQKLDYLESLGVTHIYLNPIFESAENHRYCTSDYLKIDPYLGDTNDFISLCKSAKNHNIKIIIDGVFSHTGDDSVYFNKYRHYGDGGAYNDQSSPYREWYDFGKTNDEYACWWGFKTLPNVNETNTNYLQFITGENGVLNYWQSLGAGGFRLDVADELPDLFLEKLREAVKRYDKDSLIIGEVWENAVTKESYGARRKFLLGKQCDTVMNYPFLNAITDFCITYDAKRFYTTVMEILDMYPPQSIECLMNSLSTHDTSRAINRLGASLFPPREKQAHIKLSADEKKLGIQRFMTAAALQYTLPGIPCVYYGDEAGSEGFGDPACRRTYPWQNENLELLTLHKQLGIIRKNYAKEFTKPLVFETAQGGILIFNRGKIRVIANGSQNVIKTSGKRLWGYNAKDSVLPQGVVIEEV